MSTSRCSAEEGSFPGKEAERKVDQTHDKNTIHLEPPSMTRPPQSYPISPIDAYAEPLLCKHICTIDSQLRLVVT